MGLRAESRIVMAALVERFDRAGFVAGRRVESSSFGKPVLGRLSDEMEQAEAGAQGHDSRPVA